jgi:hypothetical protein
MGARLMGSSVGSKVGKLVGAGVVSIGAGVVAIGTGVVTIGGGVTSIGAGDTTVMPIVGTSVLTMGGVVTGVSTTGGSVAGSASIGESVVGDGSIGAGVVGGDDVGGGKGGYDMSIFSVLVQKVTSSIVISSSLVALFLYCSLPLPYLIRLFRSLTREFCDDIVCASILAPARHPAAATRIVVHFTPTIIISTTRGVVNDGVVEVSTRDGRDGSHGADPFCR